MMHPSDPTRWQLRLGNFVKAMTQLDSARGQASYTDLERAGLVQTFAFSFELARKTLKDLLIYEGHEATSPRLVIPACLSHLRLKPVPSTNSWSKGSSMTGSILSCFSVHPVRF